MTTAAAGDALSPRIDAVERELGEVYAGLAASRRSRLLILALVVAFVVAIAWMFYSLYARVTSEAFLAELQAAGQTHLEENQEIYAAEAQKLADFSGPVLLNAFKTQTEQDMPKYSAAIEAQRQALLDDLQPQIEELVNEKYGEVLASFQQTLSEQFPEAKDPEVQERILANLEVAMRGLVEKYYVQQFQTQMQAMYETWDNFPVADAPTANDAPLTDQLIGYLLEIMTYKLANPPQDIES